MAYPWPCFGAYAKIKIAQKVRNFPLFTTFVSAQIEMVPQNYQKLENEDQAKQMEKLIDAMEDDDDVQNVWHNWEE